MSDLPVDASSKAVLSGVIISIRSGNSYDQLFQTVKQQSPDGQYIQVYTLDASMLGLLHGVVGRTGQAGQTGRDQLANIARDLALVPNDTVVINFECCSGFQHGFASKPVCACKPSSKPVVNSAKIPKLSVSVGQAGPAGQAGPVGPAGPDVLDFVELAISRGFMVMMSDFSVKALMKDWTTQRPVLGSNCLVGLGVANFGVQLWFDKHQLRSCCSTQLKALAELSTSTTADIHCMSDTILFGINHRVADQSQHYKLSVLTIATHCDKQAVAQSDFTCELAGKHGAVGHAMLVYPSGGILMLAGSHWLELCNIHTDKHQFFDCVDKLYGRDSQTCNRLRNQYDSLDSQQQAAWLQRSAQQTIQSQSPYNSQPSQANQPSQPSQPNQAGPD